MDCNAKRNIFCDEKRISEIKMIYKSVSNVKKNFLFVLFFLVFVVFLFGCIKEQDTDGDGDQLTGSIKVSGAWALYPMMIKWSEEFQAIHPGVRIDVSAGGAGKGMSDALGGLVDIGMISREIYPEEADKGAFWVAVAKDAVVPTANENNPVLSDVRLKGIKADTFKSMWLTGDITTWGEVVGRSDIDEPLQVYTRSDACGAAQTWAQYLGVNQEDLQGTGVYGDPGIAEAVRQDVNGVGYNNVNYAYDPSTGEPVSGIVVLPIDLNDDGLIDEDEDFYSTRDELIEAIASDVYPSPPARDLYLVTKDGFDGVTREFVEWILTDGQAYVSETGYVPLSENSLEDGLSKIE